MTTPAPLVEPFAVPGTAATVHLRRFGPADGRAVRAWRRRTGADGLRVQLEIVARVLCDDRGARLFDSGDELADLPAAVA